MEETRQTKMEPKVCLVDQNEAKATSARRMMNRDMQFEKKQSLEVQLNNRANSEQQPAIQVDLSRNDHVT